MDRIKRFLTLSGYTLGLLILARIIHALIILSFENRGIYSYFFLFILSYSLIAPVYLARNIDEVGKTILDGNVDFAEAVLTFTEEVVPFGKRSLPLMVIIKIANEYSLFNQFLPAERLVGALIGLNYAAFISIILFTETEISERKKEKISMLRDFLEHL